MRMTAVSLSGADPVGRLYFDGVHYVRLVAPGLERAVGDLFSSGLIKALVERGLFPETVELPIAGDGQVPCGHSLAVRHRALTPLVYPREWSFAMLQAAALRFLELVELAFSYGYTLKDAHPFNMVFYGTVPIWVDLGSFCKILPEQPHPWLRDFLINYLTPLRIWDKYPFVVRKIAGSPLQGLDHAECVRLTFLPLGRGTIVENICKIISKLSYIDNYRGRNILISAAKALLGRDTKSRLAKLRTKVQVLKGSHGTPWKTYHKEYLTNNLVPSVLSERFEHIFARISKTKPRSVLELAGNAGVLSEAIARRMPEVSVICTDNDSQAIDALFRRLECAVVSNLSFAVLDFMCTEYSSAELEPDERLRSDVVLALAVTHHLLLTQGYSFSDIFAAIKRYACRSVFIEYMPLGLHDGVQAPEKPDWYTEENFRRAFEEYFSLDCVDHLEENRVLFCGSIK